LAKEFKRDFWKTKTFWGCVIWGGALAIDTYLGWPTGPLKELAMLWTGMSVADRFRKD